LKRYQLEGVGQDLLELHEALLHYRVEEILRYKHREIHYQDRVFGVEVKVMGNVLFQEKLQNVVQ